MIFNPITIQDMDTLNKYLIPMKTRMCEHCFTDLFIWSGHYNTQFSIVDEFLYIRSGSNEGETFYLAPIGTGDYSEAINAVINDAETNGTELRLIGINDDIKSKIESCASGVFEFTENRDSEEYIYNSSDLMNLTGKKYHAKRNYINRFINDYQDRYSFQPITEDNLGEVLAFHEKWCNQNECKADESLRGEVCAVIAGLNNRIQLGLQTGVLYLDDDIIGYSFGTYKDDTLIIHIEKADASIDGAYPMINKCMAMTYGEAVQYINREEDLGLEGLRKAKLSYHPVMLPKKYSAVLKNV